MAGRASNRSLGEYKVVTTLNVWVWMGARPCPSSARAENLYN